MERKGVGKQGKALVWFRKYKCLSRMSGVFIGRVVAITQHYESQRRFQN